MKLLLDENLSRRLIPALPGEFAGSTHVILLGMESATDEVVWSFAAENSYVLVSKDSDFLQRAILRGSPPKLIWLRVGNCSTADVAALLRGNIETIKRFCDDDAAAVLLLPS